MNTAQENIADRVAKLAKEKGWSHTALSLRAELGKGVVTDLIQNPNRKPRESTIFALAKALDVAPGYLTGEVSDGYKKSSCIEGVGWVKSKPDQSITPITKAIESSLESGPNTILAFTVSSGVSAFNFPSGTTLLVEAGSPAKTGEMVLCRDAIGRISVNYFVEPYLIEVTSQDAPTHTVNSSEIDIIGRIVFSCKPE